MNKTKEKLNIAFRVVKISTIKFSCEEADENLISNISNKNSEIDFNIGVNLKIDKAKSTISIDVITNLVDNKKNVILLEHIGRTVFEIKGLDQTIDAEKNKFNLPDQLLLNLYTLSYSHSRALLSISLNGSSYQDKFFLPVIDPRNFLKANNSLKNN